MSGEGTPEDDERAARDAVSAGVEAVFQAGSAKRKRVEEGLEELKRELSKKLEEAERVRVEANVAAAKVKEDAETEAAEILRKAGVEREALDAEKAAMEKTYDVQTSKIKLDVGGHTFTTSRTTLTSVPDTYLDSMFGGRFLLSPDSDGAFFIDRKKRGPLRAHPRLLARSG